MISRYFTPAQLRGLTRAGEVLLPGTDRSPSFSATGCITHMDRMAETMRPQDLEGLSMLLSIFARLPRPGIALLLKACGKNGSLPGPLGAGLRMLEIGLKGAVFSPYYANLTAPDYSGSKVHEVIGWNPKFVSVPTPERDPLPTVDLTAPIPEDIPLVYDRARAVQDQVRDWGVKKRLEMISALKAGILARQEEILDRVQADTGKSRMDALTAEIFGVLDWLSYLETSAAKSLADQKVPTPFALMGKQSWVYFEPLGTVLLISPWNYPFYQAIVPITQALVCGNAVVFKPSKETPLTGLVEDLLNQAGLPQDWVQIVYGSGSRLGPALVDGKPDKIFLIGSPPVGRTIMAQAAQHLIPVELELGGKDPMVVFDDVDIPRAVAGALWGAFTTTGQSCTSVERLFVQSGIYEEFKTALVAETRKLTLGTDKDGSTDIGPMTTAAQVKEIAEQVADARAKGAVFLTGGDWDGETPQIPPMVVEGVTPEMLLDQRENFGPILPIYSFDHEAEAVSLANDPEYGLSASVWSNDMDRADRVARAIRTGNVSINNVMLTEGNPALPFGGVNSSGFGRYKGEFGYHAFTTIKSILKDKNSVKMEANWFPYTPEKYRLFSNLTRALFSPGRIMPKAKAAFHGLRLEHYVTKIARSGRK